MLTLSIALFPKCLESLSKDKSWHNFLIGLVLLSPHRALRQTAAEQFALVATRCSGEQQSLRFFTSLLFSVLNNTVNEKAENCSEYFLLLSRLVSFAAANCIQLPSAESLLSSEIQWLRRVRENTLKTGIAGVEDPLLEGHLFICRWSVAWLLTSFNVLLTPLLPLFILETFSPL